MNKHIFIYFFLLIIECLDYPLIFGIIIQESFNEHNLIKEDS